MGWGAGGRCAVSHDRKEDLISFGGEVNLPQFKESKADISSDNLLSERGIIPGYENRAAFFGGGGWVRGVCLSILFWPRYSSLDLKIKPFFLFSFLARSSQPHLVASLTVTFFMAILQLRML